MLLETDSPKKVSQAAVKSFPSNIQHSPSAIWGKEKKCQDTFHKKKTQDFKADIETSCKIGRQLNFVF
jgi:hypothetical protein